MEDLGFVTDEELEFYEFGDELALADQLYPHQRRIYNDPSRFRGVLGTRRAGKTELDAAEVIAQAEAFPGETIPFVGPTLGKARGILWPILDRVKARTGMKLDYARQGSVCHTPRGGRIELGGLATIAEVEKGRGQRYPLVVFTESGWIPSKNFERALKETYGPATKDFRTKGGRGILAEGSPSYLPKGYWHDLIGGNEHKSKLGASVHFLSIDDNLFFGPGEAEAILAEVCEENKCTRDDPWFLREWRGQFCIDAVGLCYRGWSKVVLPRHTIPLTGYTTLGLDLGHDHPCSWVIVRMVQRAETVVDRIRVSFHAHVLEAYEESGCNVHDVARITKEFVQRYHVGNIVGDSGGLGSMVIADLRERFNVAAQPALKAGFKRDRIWFTNSMLAAQTLHIHEGCEPLEEQFMSIPWNDKGTDHHEMVPDHSCDALHYALQDVLQQVQDVELPPAPGSRAAILAANARDIRRTIERGRGRF